MNPNFEEFERNQSDQERHFGIMKKRQSGRPNLRPTSLLVEEQNKQFSKYPDIFKSLNYENAEAEASLGCYESDDEIEENTEKGEEGNEDIELVIQKLLMEREDVLSDSEDEELIDEEEK